MKDTIRCTNPDDFAHSRLCSSEIWANTTWENFLFIPSLTWRDDLSVWNHPTPTCRLNGAASGLATMAHDAVVTPLDVVKQRMQVYPTQVRWSER